MTPQPVREPRPSVPWRRRSRRAAIVALALAAAAALFVLYEAVTWPDVKILATTLPTTTAFVERSRRLQRRASASGDVKWTPVLYARISGNLKRAVVAAEDMEFFSHDGFSEHEARIALEKAWKERTLPRGASTITQQLAKNLWLSPSRNPLRKAKEALLTRQLEKHLEKRRILELYLNVVELGPGIHGAEAAARHYFGKPASDLTEREAAMLAASLPRPSTWHPGCGRAGYEQAVARVLGRMRQARWLANEI